MLQGSQRIIPSPGHQPAARRLADGLILALIVGLAAYTRLSGLDLVEFKYDEAAVGNLARALVEGRQLPLAGIVSSAGVANAPLFIYLMALPLAFSPSAALATGFLGLLNVGAVFLCYRLGSQYFGKRVGQVSSLLLAASPWATYFSRKIQAQDALIPFTIVFATFLFGFALKGRPRDLAGMLLALALTIQLHLAGLALAPVALVALLLFRGQVRARGLLWGLGLAAASFVPYGIWQWSQGGAELGQALARVQGAVADLEPAAKALDMMGGLVYAYLAPGVADLADGSLIDGLYWAEVGLFVLSLGYLAWAVIKDRAQRDKLALLLLWGVLPTLFFTWRSFAFYPHYLLVVFPMPYLALGLLVSRGEGWARGTAIQARPKAVSWLATSAWAAGMLLLAGVVLVQTVAFGRFITLVEAGATTSDYGVPLRHLEAAVERAAALGQERAQPVYLVAPNRDLGEAFRFLSHGRPGVRVFDSRRGLLLPPGQAQAVYLVPEDSFSPDSPAHQLLRAEITRASRQREGNLSFYLLSGGGETVAQWPALDFVAPGMKAKGALVSQRLRAGETAQLAIFWEATKASRPLTLFAHLVDSQGRAWGGMDQGAHPSAWQEGDRVVSWLEFPVGVEAPTGGYWLEVGVYPSGQPVRLPLATSQGQPLGDSVRLGPIKVLSPDWPPPPPRPQHPHGADFGDLIRFLGYDLHREEGRLRLKLYWMAFRKIEADYTVFVHLADELGTLVAQQDGPPQGGSYPTSLWDEGEFVSDEVELLLPPKLAPGLYRLYLGLYRWEDMEHLRLPWGGERLDAGMVELPEPTKVSVIWGTSS